MKIPCQLKPNIEEEIPLNSNEAFTTGKRLRLCPIQNLRGHIAHVGITVNDLMYVVHMAPALFSGSPVTLTALTLNVFFRK